MRQGPFELCIVSRNRIAYAEEHFGGKNYIRAVEGGEYKVKVEIHPDTFGNFPFQHARISVRIDGIALSYCRQMDLHKKNRTKFRGFRKNENTLRSFVFSSPAVNASSSTNKPTTTKMGTVEVIIYAAVPSDVLCVKNLRSDKVLGLSGGQEDKKFWQQASLNTAGGTEIRQKHRNNPVYVYEYQHQNPAATLVLHYHTPEMIDFLKHMHLQQQELFVAPHVPVGPPVHIDLSTHHDEIPAVPAPAPVIDLMQEVSVRVKRENTSGGAGNGSARKKARSSSSSGQMSMQIVDLT